MSARIRARIRAAQQRFHAQDGPVPGVDLRLELHVEGAEVDALIGAAKLLRLCRPKIFVEVHTQLIGKFGYNLTDFFSQIPADLYDIKFIVEGVDSAWRPYEAGLEAGVTAPLLVFATPKQPKGGGLLP